jgi:pimeloyl-ACP methyl ester carboxylesterase
LALDHTSQTPEMEGATPAIIGHSAGGHLALWAANRPGPSITGLAVGLAAVTDLESLAASGGSGSNEARRLLAAGAPRVLDAAPSTFLVHGEHDQLVPVSHSLRLSETARVRVFPELSHFDMLDPTKEHWSAVFAALENAEN